MASSLKPKTPPGIGCQQSADRDDCPLVCKYNYFQSDELTIHAWELKCADCGFRDTVGFRSDEQDDDAANDDTADCPTRCPFCYVDNLRPGLNPCQHASPRHDAE